MCSEQKVNNQIHRFYLDIDECNGEKNVCNQTCNNSVGSYDCSCEPGYKLALDGFSCDGKTNLSKMKKKCFEKRI